MLDQNDYNKLSNLTETDFRAIVTAVEGGIDWEYMVLLLEDHYFDRSVEMCRSGWSEAADEYLKKAEKIRDFRRKL